MKRSLIAVSLSLVAAALTGAAPNAGKGASLKVEYPGKVIDCQGVAALRPANQERWTPLEISMLLSKGDWIRSEVRGANAVQIRLANQDRIILGPGGLIELVDENTVNLIRGEAEVTPVKDSKLTVRLPGDVAKSFHSPTILHVTETAYTVLENEPNWLKYLKGKVTHESMGALVAKVDGRDLPLTLGYHKVTVDIRDQIARTVIEESFVNHTRSQLEGVFFFPLPQDASISGFAMWIGDELVEADVVEKERAREIYETILREKRDPGLLEWTGGNIFKARVFPIFAHSEKRIRITYTQVLPRNGNQYRYSYALQSEMLKQTPLRELELKVNVFSEEPIDKVACLSHNARVNRTKNAATVEFAAQEYTPTQDFEVEIDVKQGDEPIVLIPHRRGDDGYFLLMVNPPEKQRKGRPVLTDGPPLDLIVVADTSASMDRQQRQSQDQFIGFLFGSLGKHDRFRVMAADAETVWFNTATNAPPDTAYPPSEEIIEKARTFLANRVSLGWTDLGKTLEEVLKFAGKNTQIVYIGDGIDTSKDNDPGSIAKSLKRIYLAGGERGTVHAVAVSSSYEPMVMKTMASLGAGSFRRLDGTAPARNGAMGLLEELTTPGIRDMKVEFKGLRVAKVYPDELPNLPAGRQQIVLGRYLPEGKDQKGTVIVSGEYKGKTVRYEATTALKDAESGNAFIPRLWARMHLESLLEQGQTPEVKNDIIALSEEYAIMTPYTSFLVLESDTDRERFSVKRRFKMRDGEKFFAEGRESANFQLRQKQMQLAGAWRQDLRRQVLRDLMTMGRALPSPQPYSGECDFYGASDGLMSCRPVLMAPSLSWGRPAGGASHPFPVLSRLALREDAGSSETGAGRRDANGRSLDRTDTLGFDDTTVSDYFDADREEQPSADAPEEPSFEGSDGEFDQKKELSKRAENRDYRSRLFDVRSVSANKPKSSMRRWAKGGKMSGNYANADYIQRCSEIGYGTPEYNHSWMNTLFPYLPPAPPLTATPVNTNWSAAARALSRSLLRQEKLSAMTGGIEIRTTRKAFDCRRNVTIAQTVSETLYSTKSWVQTVRPDGGQTVMDWYDGKERGVFAPCYQLGRHRAAEASDANLREPGNHDFSCASLESSYSGCTAELRNQDDATALLVLRDQHNATYEMRYKIDTTKHVLLAFETWNVGRLQSRTTYADFIEVAGAWWATNISVENGEGRQTSSATVTIRPVDERTFTKESESRMAVTRKDSIVIAEPLPTLSDARQAEKDAKVSFDQFLTLVSQHMQLQEHDKVLADWTAAKTLVKNQPGAEWLETEVLLQIRRNEEARQKIRKSAAKLAATPIPDDLYLANALYNQMCRIGQYNEVLTLLDDLKPVHERQPKHLAAMTTFHRTYAETLRNVGRAEEAVVIWKKLADESPSDLGIQTRYVQVLAEMGNPDMAFDYVTQLLAKTDFWTREERDSIRSSVAYSFMNGIQTDKWLAFVEAWMAEGAPNQNACQFYLSALYSMNKVADMRRVTTAWIEEGIAAYASAAPADPADKQRQLATVRMQPAFQMALGQGYSVYTDYVDPYWYPLLSRTVKELFNNDSAMNIAGQIIQHYRFSQTDEARKLRQHFVTVLSKEALTLKPQVINQVVGWILVDAAKVDMEVWKDVAERLEERWAKEGDITAKNQLATAVFTVLSLSDPDVGLLRFLRRQYKESSRESVPNNALALFSHLLSRNWSEAYGTEAFALLPQLSSATNDEQRVAELVPRLYDLTDGLIQRRINAGSASSEARSKMSRQELAAEQSKLRAAAKEGLIERLRKESSNQEDALRPWLTIERLSLEVQLNKDAKSIAGECWELLPQKPWINTGTNWFRLHLFDRAMTTLVCLASRKSADAQLVTRVHAYIDAGIAATAGTFPKESGSDSAGSYWRYQKYRLLVARDESKALEEDLAKWITPENADPTWRYAMGYLMAEQGRIADAIRQFEILEKADLLDQSDYRALAGWYMAADQRDKHEAALVKALARIPDYELSNRLYRHLSLWQQNNEKVPAELDPEVPRIFTSLFNKAQNPADYLGLLREFYQRSRDARMFQCMAEGMFGHTAQQTYPFVQSMAPVLNEIRDESIADALLQKIGELRPRSKTTVDNRALDFLEMQVCRRAAEVRNQPGPHIAKALAAMQRVFAGDWATGERRLMADLLASLGKIASEELVREQLRQLRELHQCRTEPAEDRLAIAAHLARALWTCEKRDDAIDVLDAALTEYRQTMNGVLPATANNAIESYVAYLEGRQRFTRGESWLQAELGRPANQQQQYWLVRRLLTLYVNTVQAKAEVTLGNGAALCCATYAKMVPELDRPDRNHRRAVLSLACNLFEAAKRTGIESPEAREFAFTVCPAVLAKETEPSTYRNLVTQVGRMLKTVLGPLTSLEFLVERLEREPQWLSVNRNYPGWQTYAYELGRCREEAKPTGTMETRLLNVVTAELRRDLTERRELNRCIYARHNNYFWSEKAAEFKAVAEAVWREQKASGMTVLHIANYLWHGLGEHDRAIEILAEAHGNQLLEESGQATLVSFLHSRNRFAESIPILVGLIAQRPDTIQYRTQLMTAYFKVQDGDKLRRTLTEADKHFHEGGRWQEGNIASLAYACVNTALNEESVKYYGELIPLRKRTLGGRAVGDSALSEYYRQLANAHMGLGRTAEAVDAASGAIVVWGQNQSNRNNAMNVLQDVLRRSPDLAKYVATLEKQVAENNMENPIVRKALGRVFLEKNDTKEAIRHLSLAMDVQPNDRETCDAIVSAYDRMNDKPGAIRQILTTVDLSRRDIALYAELGKRYLAEGDKVQSERAYLSIAEMLPNESESHTMLAEIRQQQNRWDDAIHHWRQVVRVRSLEPTGFQRLANALIHQKQWKEAVENIDILAKRNWPQRFGDVRAMAETLRRQVPSP